MELAALDIRFGKRLHDSLNHNKVGTLAMANTGTPSNGVIFTSLTCQRPDLNGG